MGVVGDLWSRTLASTWPRYTTGSTRALQRLISWMAPSYLLRLLRRSSTRDSPVHGKALLEKVLKVFAFGILPLTTHVRPLFVNEASNVSPVTVRSCSGRRCLVLTLSEGMKSTGLAKQSNTIGLMGRIISSRMKPVATWSLGGMTPSSTLWDVMGLAIALGVKTTYRRLGGQCIR